MDLEFLHALEALRINFFDKVFYIITLLGEENILIAILLYIFWCGQKRHAYFLFSLSFIGTSINSVVKLFYHVPRPFVRDKSLSIVESARKAADGYSFPSGHTQNATQYLGGIFSLSRNKVLKVICAVLIALVAFSRMYLGVHTPQDVLVGFAIGLVLIVALKPLFFKGHGRLQIALWLSLAINILAVIVIERLPVPSDYDKATMFSMYKNTYMCFGTSLAILISYYIDRKFINFKTEASWPVQAIKFLLGLAIVIGLRIVLKPALAFLPNEKIATAVRYFIIMLFVASIWPLSFKAFERLENKFKKQ